MHTEESPFLGTRRWLVLADEPRRTVVVLLAASQQDVMQLDLFCYQAEQYANQPHWWLERGIVPKIESKWHCQVRGQQVEVTERYFEADGERQYVAEFRAMVEQPDGRRFMLWTSLVELAGPLEEHRAAVREPVRTFLESW